MKKQITIIKARGEIVDSTPIFTMLVYREYSGIHLHREYNASPASVNRMRKAVSNALTIGTFKERTNRWGIDHYERIS